MPDSLPFVSRLLGTNRTKHAAILLYYGSIRINEGGCLTRCPSGIYAIAEEIIARNFSDKTLMDMVLMKGPTNADIKQQI
ncbi:hypothetical protein GRO01_09430 [Gluconobacter roseus NBRC 3990]|uniref:Uncharacterized protein n=1 Tax=Gluconobacter roseus NBRC 3990 TaxID=1307950 RepID=A0A4Y3M4S3_9PROT|nr:hypothetical protein AD943_05775 [Gluconobacter roseus]GBR48226.1 hypothetical protein AA3990_2044 [Gluconobacter roseus NBRC 3990]GEB03367.1 hypothetical protein GRO01_09430 [Gluconobacter roseus NBRC 3990]GLP93825.1 hypothetical protein GCM10007871_18030 [Gluconobacter roseus NBRC 3990]